MVTSTSCVGDTQICPAHALIEVCHCCDYLQTLRAAMRASPDHTWVLKSMVYPTTNMADQCTQCLLFDAVQQHTHDGDQLHLIRESCGGVCTNKDIGGLYATMILRQVSC